MNFLQLLRSFLFLACLFDEHFNFDQKEVSFVVSACKLKNDFRERRGESESPAKNIGPAIWQEAEKPSLFTPARKEFWSVTSNGFDAFYLEW